MNKDLFIECIDSLKKQQEHNKKCNKAFKIILPNDFVSGYDLEIITTQFIKLLKTLLNDKSEWIDYYIYELDFGKEYKKGCVRFNNKDVKLKTSEDLWNILINNVNKEHDYTHAC